MRQRMQASIARNKAFTSNVTSSYPLLSIRGKEFTFRLPDGKSKRHEHQGFAMPYLDVVLVEASPLLSKTYYEQGFDPADSPAPTAGRWTRSSLTRPRPSFRRRPVPCARRTSSVRKSPTLARRPKHARTTAASWCSCRTRSVRIRRADGAEGAAVKLKNLKAHGELMNSYQVDINAVVTRLSFTAGVPQLLFTYTNILNEQQWEWVMNLAASPLVKAMVETPDFENAVQTPMQQTPLHNQGLKPQPLGPVPTGLDELVGTVPQQEEEADEDGVLPDLVPPMQQAKPAPVQAPVQAKPDLKPVPESNVIELPDNKWYDTVSKQYVDPPKPAVAMPELDPATLELPEGKYFNTTLKAYVTGPEVGAPVAGVTLPTPAPVKKARACRAKAPADPAPVAQAAAKEPEAQQEEAPAGSGNGIVPATAALDDVLRQAFGENG